MSSWSEYHHESELLAKRAEIEKQRGQHGQANYSYILAADAELYALLQLDVIRTPQTCGSTAVSHATLLLKAGHTDGAKQSALNSEKKWPDMPENYRKKLQEIVLQCEEMESQG